MGAAVTPWPGSMMDRVGLDDMTHKGEYILTVRKMWKLLFSAKLS